VLFRWKDDAQGNQQKVMALEAVELIRRFLLHVVPSGFVRIRHYGLQANRVRAENLARCRVLLGVGQGGAVGGAGSPPQPPPSNQEAATRMRCPVCGQGQLVIVGKVDPVRCEVPETQEKGVEATDTS
jgi:hypothetical protein